MSKPPIKPEHRSEEDTEVGKAAKLGEENQTPPHKRDKKEKE